MYKQYLENNQTGDTIQASSGGANHLNQQPK
jgi:hypothetical protein